MNSLKLAVENIVDALGESSKSYLSKMDIILHMVLNEYDRINDERSVATISMITNANCLANIINPKDTEELTKAITVYFYDCLYKRNYISESEYEKVCGQQQ